MIEVFFEVSMKQIIFALFILACLSGLSAQTSATWALTTNGNCTAVGNLTGSALVAGGGVGTVSYGTDGAYSNNWAEASLAAAQTANDYYQYTITATANISIGSISLSMRNNQPIGGMTAAVFYSVNGGGYTQIGSDTTITQTHTTTTISGLNIGVLKEQTFSIRVYCWGAQNNQRNFYNRNVVITALQSNAGDYFRTYASGNWNDINRWMSSSDNTNWIYASSTPTASANTVTIQSGHTITLTAAAACDDLAFTGGAIVLGNYNLTIDGDLTGTPYFTYSGTGVPSQTGTNAHVTVSYSEPTSLPAQMNTLIVDVGADNAMILPNDIITTTLTFDSGDIDLNGSKISLAGKDFGIASDNAVLSALDVAMSTEPNVWGGGTSIARTWTTDSSVSDPVDLYFTYPESESASNSVRVWAREEGSAGPWTLVGAYTPTANGSLRTVKVSGVTSLTSNANNTLEWTISEVDQALPVELSSFTVALSAQSFVTLQWVTQTETGVSGFYLYRNTVYDLANAERINAFVEATNTSQESSYIFVDREVLMGNTYYYWLQYIDLSGQFDFFGPVSVTVIDLGNITPIIPQVTSLQSVYPNPFNAKATVAFGLDREASVKLEILNNKGAIVRNLYIGYNSAGNYRLIWDGKADNGRDVSSGVYFVRLRADNISQTRKLVLMK